MLEQVIIKPIVSEKSTALSEVGNRYTFKVKSSATKVSVRQAVEKLFSVNVLAVRTMIVRGKTKRFAKSFKKASSWKKAIVTLKDGQKIDIFQGK